MINLEQCPICSHDIGQKKFKPEDYGNRCHVDCPYCGKYLLYGWKMRIRFGLENNQVSEHPELCIAVRSKYHITGKEVLVSADTIDNLENTVSIPTDASELAAKALKYLYAKAGGTQGSVTIPPIDYPLLYARNIDDLNTILEYARYRQYVKGIQKLPLDHYQCEITSTGIDKAKELGLPKKTLSQRELMELAVLEMTLSIPDPGRDTENPRVGAVIATPDGEVVCKAHRGELRIGDHAEFTALERKSRSENLTGCYLYTTLEPCAPGARRHPKLCCAERIHNARISKVFVGCPDPHAKVAGQGNEYLKGNGIEIDFFDIDLRDQIESHNKAYFKYALEEKRASKKKPETSPSTMMHVLKNRRFSDLSNVLLDEYIKKANIKHAMESSGFHNHLIDIGIGEGKADDFRPTEAGFLLFGTEATSLFPQARVKLTVFEEGQTEIIKDFEGPLLAIPPRIEEHLDAIMPDVISRDHFERQSVYSTLKAALREAIINAIVHRDYSIKGAHVQIQYDKQKSKFVIDSPGYPYADLSRFLQFNVPSFSRNPQIAYMFYKMMFMEERGIGLKELRSINDNGFQIRFSLESGFFRVEIATEKSVTPLDNILNDLKQEEREVYRILKDSDKLTSSQIASILNLPVRSIRRYLALLEGKGLVTREGIGPATAYTTMQ